ncbi:aminotransferase class I/II-fold pyridoxal phosphate-dependent enzyme [Leptothoe spongobia]|uniref:Aminotransferase class I/II-fold pyridoxal phosphate-dependent enzyme n=1 Tax=Leptothoe spongobia TAU-MAC 1115 TaxID=1967444 RepID=A0A947GM45_9CYAN|nr:aminotransferase class I/II-fold pyridoxal phosphate-dependent enzyme [Leptothoe spongobia]MBT9315296.1 aminotransferase class I/II-fold pyridoxal phosphate-dependent enzyme [Leptothoe spongobia TAU-MAC 1115]
MHALSPQLLKALEYQTPIGQFYAEATYMKRRTEPGSLDFTIGDAHELPPKGFVEALQKWSVPQNEGWYGYKESLIQARTVVSSSLQERRGLAIDPEDIFMTSGTMVGLAICLKMLTEAGDEVILNLPPWLGYRRLVHLSGATPVGIPVKAETFALDLEAIAAAITERTRAIIINSPHNPTGKVFSEKTLQSLGDILSEASKTYGRPIYLISDETFSRIVFDSRLCPSPTQFYPFSFLVYGYSKTLMAPGQRVGYLALSPTMPEREQIREVISMLQSSIFGWCFPSALMQYALVDLEKINPDIEHLQYKRDWLVRELREMGYEVQPPEATFFLLVKSPWQDDEAFSRLLADHGVFVFPGTPQEIPGYFRVSLTGSENMISLALPKDQGLN